MTTPRFAQIAAVFAAVLAPGCRPRDPSTLESQLEAAWRRATTAHPEIAVSPEQLFSFIAARMDDGDPASALARRNIEDLFLACGCDRGDEAALAAFEHHVMPAVERAVATFRDRSELLQILRERMLVEKAGVRGIAAYDGRAPLAIWLRVCAARIGIREAGREKRAAAVADQQLEQLAPGVPDPELAYLKRLYGAEFRAAFAHSVASLAPRSRTLLRLSVIDGLGIDQLAAIYHVHRATAARQLKQARATLVEGTRDRMRVTLRISESELESIMRMIHSMADITLRHVLTKRPSHARESE